LIGFAARRVMKPVYFLMLFILSLQTVCALADQRPITVKDAIEMTRLADVDYFWGNPSEGRVAQYAPDGRHFVVLLRKGDLGADANVYSLYLFATSEVLTNGKPNLIVQLRSSSNRPAIRELKWLSDNKTIAFAGEREKGISQVYTVDTLTRQLRQRTSHSNSVDHFDISADGQQILFTAEKIQGTGLTATQQHNGFVVQNQSLPDLIAGRYNYVPGEEALFYQKTVEQTIDVPAGNQVNTNTRLTFSPDGQFAVVTAYFRQPVSEWASYSNHSLQYWATRPAFLEMASAVFQYFLFSSASGSVRPLLQSPAYYTSQMSWAPNSRAVVVRTYLPLDSVTGQERADRERGELPAEVEIPSLALRRLRPDEWQATQVPARTDLPRITLEEAPDTPPKIFAHNLTTHRDRMIFDLNPQLSELRLGAFQELSFVVHGIPIVAGLYLPSGYVAGRRYPLVIQTHGFDPKRFSMDGCEEWSSGFAARPLAASGIMVVQMQNFANPEDHDRVGNDSSLGNTVEERFRNYVVLAYEQVIDYLNERGMTDPDQLGISGFSRTVWFVSYALTHSKTPFRAAVLTDGISGGYFEYVARRETEFDVDNGGMAPFGEAGLQLWKRESPGFNLDRLRTPTRLVSFGDLTSEWEWFVGAQLMGKPVELVDIAGAKHLLERPQDRYIAMQGIVDWYRFWLQGYERPNPDDLDQYKRWEHLRELRGAGAKAAADQARLGSAP
jgi:dipeptidyl aminopeptidase/acylaminoacyl peptidase